MPARPLSLALAVLAAALLALLAATAPRSEAAPPAATAWEYKVFTLDETEYIHTEEYKRVRAQHADDWHTAGPFREMVLRTLGKDGWELTWVEPRKGGAFLYFKRRAES